MRKFVEPEMKVMTVNMKENIAASIGTESGLPPVDGYSFYTDASGKIIGTDIKLNHGQAQKNLDALIAAQCAR